MHLIIQIPCYNEENTLKSVLEDIPLSISGISKIEVLIINDGSTDNTLRVARAFPVHHILNFKTNRGLAYSFKKGLEECLRLGADIIVNTDGDHQYKGSDISNLVKPILEGYGDMVIGCRDIADNKEFGTIKKILQYVGSWLIRKLSRTEVKDVTSGFRAFTRETALRLVISDAYTYTLESLIQAGNTPEIRLAQIDIKTNSKTRESRLISDLPSYIRQSFFTISRMFVYYSPFKFFFALTVFTYFLSFFLGIRFLFNTYLLKIEGRSYLPSLILLSIFFILGSLSFMMGFLGLINGINRSFILENLYLSRKSLYDANNGKLKK